MSYSPGFAINLHPNRRKNRKRDKKRRDFIHEQPCICEASGTCQGEIEGHHAGNRGHSQTAPEDTLLPLCWAHHSRWSKISAHVLGVNFWKTYGLDRDAEIAKMRAAYERMCGHG